MDLRQLEYFAAVAEEGGFGRAAERLHIVQSAVSQQIGRLERELGLRLFDRTTRRVRITAAGERLLAEARATLSAADRFRTVATAVADGAEGAVRLGTVRFPDDRVYRLLDDVARRAPRLQIRPQRLPVAARLTAVRSGDLDAALVRAPVTAPDLASVPVWTDPLLVALPAHHPIADEPTLLVEQLAGLPLRLAPRERNPPFHDLVTVMCRAAGVNPPAGPPFRDLETTMTDIATGEPTWTVFYAIAEPPQTERIAIRPLAEPAITTSLVFRAGSRAPGLRHLLAAAQAAARRAHRSQERAGAQ